MSHANSVLLSTDTFKEIDRYIWRETRQNWPSDFSLGLRTIIYSEKVPKLCSLHSLFCRSTPGSGTLFFYQVYNLSVCVYRSLLIVRIVHASLSLSRSFWLSSCPSLRSCSCIPLSRATPVRWTNHTNTVRGPRSAENLQYTAVSAVRRTRMYLRIHLLAGHTPSQIEWSTGSGPNPKQCKIVIEKNELSRSDSNLQHAELKSQHRTQHSTSAGRRAGKRSNFGASGGPTWGPRASEFPHFPPGWLHEHVHPSEEP